MGESPGSDWEGAQLMDRPSSATPRQIQILAKAILDYQAWQHRQLELREAQRIERMRKRRSKPTDTPGTEAAA